MSNSTKSNHINDECNIERCTANDNFSIIPNEITQHPTMSADASMVLIYLLSCKPEWVIKPKNVWKSKNISRDHVYKAFDELIKLGYMERITLCIGNLKSSVTYRVSYLNKFLRHPESRDTEFRDTESQDALIRTTHKKNDLKKNNNKPNLSDSAPSAIIIPSFLSSLEGIDEPLQRKLADEWKDDPDRLSNACSVAANYSEGERPAILITALKNGWKQKASKEDVVKGNTAWAIKHLLPYDMKKIGEFCVYVNVSSVTISSEHFEYSDPEFQANVKDYVRRIEETFGLEKHINE